MLPNKNQSKQGQQERPKLEKKITNRLSLSMMDNISRL